MRYVFDFFFFFFFSPVDGNGLGLMGLSNQTRPLSPVGFEKDLDFFFFLNKYLNLT